MLALVYDGRSAAVRADYPQPTPREGEALVAVRMAGVCNTDLEVLDGYMGFSGVMGHEFVGCVVRGPRAWRDRRVVGEINCVCGRCDMCRRGLSNHCRDRTVVGIAGRDGVFAEQVALPVRNLHAVPEALGDVEAVFVEPLAAACQIVRQVEFDRRDNVVVLGDGKLAQLIVRVLKPMLRRIVLVGKHPVRLEAAEKAGVQTHAAPPPPGAQRPRTPPRTAAPEFVPDARADVVIDATGSPSGLELALRAVRPRGTIVLKSTFSPKKSSAAVNLSPLVVDEVRLIGSRCGPFPDALRLLAAGEVDVAPLVSARFPLSRGIDAIEAARSKERLKVLIDVG